MFMIKQIPQSQYNYCMSAELCLITVLAYVVYLHIILWLPTELRKTPALTSMKMQMKKMAPTWQHIQNKQQIQ